MIDDDMVYKYVVSIHFASQQDTNLQLIVMLLQYQDQDV
jgi:hypothetical protein